MLPVIDDALAEESPPVLLFRYRAGDDLTTLGSVFTRASTATYFDSSSAIQTASSGVARDGHYIGGARKLLLEGQRTNSCTFAEQLDNAAWGKLSLTVTANAATAPDGAATADKLVEAAANARHSVYKTSAFGTMTAGNQQATSFFVKAAERTWAFTAVWDNITGYRYSWIDLSNGVVGTLGSGVTITLRACQNGWYRVEMVWTYTAGASSFEFHVGPATADATHTYLGDGASGIYAFGVQNEVDQLSCSSYIPTAAGAVTRSADLLYFPLTGAAAVPSGKTIYSKLTDVGEYVTVNGIAWELSDDTVPLLELLKAGLSTVHVYKAIWDTSGTDSSSTHGTNTTLGDSVEHRVLHNTDYSVQIFQTLNAGSEVSAAAGVAGSAAAAYHLPRLYLGNNTSSQSGFIALDSVAIFSGTRTLVQCRALVAA